MGFFNIVLIIFLFLNLASSQSHFGRRFILNDLIAPRKVHKVYNIGTFRGFLWNKETVIFFLGFTFVSQAKQNQTKNELNFYSKRAYVHGPIDATEDEQQIRIEKAPLSFAHFDGPVACR
jgi:hypothetical protein